LIKLLNPKFIKIPEGRGREDFSEVIPLRSSIEANGLLHNLVVKDLNDGTYRLIAGETRYKALLLLPSGWPGCKVEDGVPLFPCEVRGSGEEDSIDPVREKLMELEENVRRKDLDWPEECEMLRQIHELRVSTGESDTFGDTAENLGISVTTIQNQVKIAKKLKDRPDLAKEVTKLPYEVARREFDKKVSIERLKVREARGELSSEVTLKRGDVRDLIFEVEESSVDLIVTDPPFGLGAIEDLGEAEGMASQSYAAKLEKTDNLTEEEVIALFTHIARPLWQALKPGRYFFMFLPILPLMPKIVDIFNHLGAWSICGSPLIWDKDRSTSPFKGYEFMPSYEAILYGYREPRERRLLDPGKNILKFSSLESANKIHPFEKPQDLLHHLIKSASDPGELVLDPFAGSGSTLLAARDLRRRSLGFELNESNYLLARGRLSDATAE